MTPHKQRKKKARDRENQRARNLRGNPSPETPKEERKRLSRKAWNEWKRRNPEAFM